MQVSVADVGNGSTLALCRCCRSSVTTEHIDKECHNTYSFCMTSDLKSEIRQTKPFPSRQEEAALNLRRTDAVLGEAFDRLLAPFGISATQYNVLRILRGAGADGLCRNEIRDRLVSRMPDVTRLLDRMEEGGLITRSRSATDRRMVFTLLTHRGRELVDALDAPVASSHATQLGHLSDEQLQTLIALLELARRPAR